MLRSHELPEVPTVFVVDPDPSTGQTLSKLLDGSEIGCEFYRSGREFLAAYCDGQPGCLVLEQRIPDMSGLQLQHRLAASGAALPLIFVTARPDVSTAVEFMRGGAVHVLEKPVRTAELLDAIREAIALDRGRRVARIDEILCAYSPRTRRGVRRDSDAGASVTERPRFRRPRCWTSRPHRRADLFH